MIELNDEQQAMLDGERGVAKQMAMRLVLDMAAAAGATRLTPIGSAHLSGVSPLTGGLGLRQFLQKLTTDPQAKVAVATTLNSAGCDMTQFEQMRISAPDFLEHNREIVALYTQLGVQPTQSCIPYEWEGVVTEGIAAWAESNAICFGNSYCGLRTNRESGLSALAAALSGYTPYYGLLQDEANRPNLHVKVTVDIEEPTDFSILGDWIGAQRQPSWQMPFGPIPLISGLPPQLSHDQRKALSAAAANYGSPRVVIGSEEARDEAQLWQAELLFDEAALQQRRDALAPQSMPSLIVLGCPQASVSELRAIAVLLGKRRVLASPQRDDTPLLWVFTSRANLAIAENTGVAQRIRAAGALLLADTCPEVVPYDRRWVYTILTNSMKAEHYIKSGLNGIATSVTHLADCLDFACGERTLPPSVPPQPRQTTEAKLAERQPALATTAPTLGDGFACVGRGLPSQQDFVVEGEAFVSTAPITLLGFVNRESGVIEEPGHPADGQSMAGKIAIFPKGSGSTVAPYVLLELFYRGNAPLAIVNSDIDQQSAPACSLEGIPYAYSFDRNPVLNVRSGDRVELRRDGERVTLRVIG